MEARRYLKVSIFEVSVKFRKKNWLKSVQKGKPKYCRITYMEFKTSSKNKTTQKEKRKEKRKELPTVEVPSTDNSTDFSISSYESSRRLTLKVLYL